MKSHARDLLEVVTCVIKDACNKCTAVAFDHRDTVTLVSRLKHEGLSFLTITLPSFGQDFERSLAIGGIEPTFFRSFRKKGGIPAFLSGILALVFDRTTGRLLNDPSIEAIEGIRQIAYTFKKLQVDCHPKRIAAAIDGFKECERDLQSPITPDDQEYFLEVSSCLWDSHFSDFSLDDCLPKHGPGATRERISGNRKYKYERWHERLEPYFPFLGTALSERSCFGAEFKRVTFVNADCEQPVRVITVPKTLKGPRIIAIEPVCMQYTQQAISRYLVRSLEARGFSAGHVNFTDQRINQRAALISSKDGRLSTLDLSSASDRVPLSLAIRMFDGNPVLRDAILACRSRSAELPSGEIITLRKFASMGSALCFPIESMYFFTVVLGSLLKAKNLSVTRRNLKQVSSSVLVYGDDIVVPTYAAVAVMGSLASYACKVNTHKSFWTGKFRESCGMDAYDGDEVTPTYIRQMPPISRRSSRSIVSWVATSNLLYKRGYWITAHHLREKVESIIGALPIVGERCPGLGLVSYMGYPAVKSRGRYQRPEVRAWVPAPVYRKDELDGYGALAKCLLALESPPDIERDVKHLSRTVRSGVVTLKRQWVPIA